MPFVMSQLTKFQNTGLLRTESIGLKIVFSRISGPTILHIYNEKKKKKWDSANHGRRSSKGFGGGTKLFPEK